MPLLITRLLALQLCASFAALATSPLYLESRETGVESCSLELKTSDVPGLAAVTDVARFGVIIHLRYLSTPSTSGHANQVRIQGAIYSDVPERPLPPPAPGTAAPKLPFDPPSFNFDPGLVLRPLAASSNHSGFKLEAKVVFSLGFVTSTVPSYFEASLAVPAGHDFDLSALHGGPGLTCTVRPTLVPNRLDPRGIHVDLDSMRRSRRAVPAEAAVIGKPLFNMRMDLAAALIDRHIQHYAMIGFTRYIMYLQPRDIEPLLAQPRALKWVQQGFLQLVKWDAVPDHHPVKPLWDQRVVYTHAVLAHLGRPIFLLMSDLDEYMVSLKPGLFNVFDMVQQCTGPEEDLVNFQLTRMHVIAKSWHDRTQSEQPLWMPDTRDDHPIMQAHLINQKHNPFYKSMVNPNAIKVYYVHVGTQYNKYNITRPDKHCLVLAHAVNVNSGREHGACKIADRYAIAPAWLSALARLGRQREQWLAGSSSEAVTTGPNATAAVAAALQVRSGTVAEVEPRQIATVGPAAMAAMAATSRLEGAAAHSGAKTRAAGIAQGAINGDAAAAAAIGTKIRRVAAAVVASLQPGVRKGGDLWRVKSAKPPAAAAGGPKRTVALSLPSDVDHKGQAQRVARAMPPARRVMDSASSMKGTQHQRGDRSRRGKKQTQSTQF